MSHHFDILCHHLSVIAHFMSVALTKSYQEMPKNSSINTFDIYPAKQGIFLIYKDHDIITSYEDNSLKGT